MSTFDLDKNVFQKEARIALLAGVQMAHYRITQITPRDEARMPQNIDRKDGKTPIRTTGRGVVSKGGHWYVWVTGNLERSIAYEEIWPMDFIIWVVRGPTEEYARAQEFGTPRIPARSFLRKGIIDNSADIIRLIEGTFQQLTKA